MIFNSVVLLQMFHHILTREREVFWEYGEVTCAAFSLKNLDTVRDLFKVLTGFCIFFCYPLKQINLV